MKYFVTNINNWQEGQQESFMINNKDILIIKHQNQFFAIENLCTHQKVELKGGRLTLGKIACPKHGAKFDLLSGKACSLPAVKPLKIFAIELENEQLFINI